MSDPADLPEPDCAPSAPHPRHCPQVIGQARAEADFLTAFNSGRLHHGWLLTGPRGVGKASFAWAVARFLLATPPAGGDGLFGAPPPPRQPAHRPGSPGRTAHARPVGAGVVPLAARAERQGRQAGRRDPRERGPQAARLPVAILRRRRAPRGHRRCRGRAERAGRERHPQDAGRAARPHDDAADLAPARATLADDPLALPRVAADAADDRRDGRGAGTGRYAGGARRCRRPCRPRGWFRRRRDPADQPRGAGALP